MLHVSNGHNTTSEIPPSDQQKPKSPKNEFEDAYRTWLYTLPRAQNRSQRINLRQIFTTAWHLVQKDQVQIGQQIIKKLAAEEGLQVIKALTDDVFSGAGLSKFKHETLPFLRVVSHPRILASLILETPLATIFNFLFGQSGQRAIDLFSHVSTSVATLSHEASDESEDIIRPAVTSAITIFGKVVELNQTAQINPSLQNLLEDIASAVPENILSPSTRILVRLRQRFEHGLNLPTPESMIRRQAPSLLGFEIGQDFPGRLSDSGPRHDNDHENISDIRILPTTAEILSDRSEYLPSRDSSRHHVPGLEGLIDRHFRLLREDTVGQVRDAVQVEIHRLGAAGGSQSSAAQRQADGIRTVAYQNLRLLRPDFDRKKGLQFVVEFDQPHPLRTKTVAERKEWWTNSKRLQIGSFVCLVFGSGRVIFLSVSDAEPTPPRSNKDGDQDGGEVDRYEKAVQEKPSLTRDPDKATVMLSPVEHNEDDLVWMLEHLGRHIRHTQSLVEFPGILLPSFQHTLEALQMMSRKLDLPFSSFVAPEQDVEGEIEVPPPWYAMQPGFTYDLSGLTNKVPLALSPGKLFDFAVLKEHSTLDEAQQVSTIQALSSSLALIQGPPGTGKSFTGVAIINALLKNRGEADLGPVICVCYTNHALDQLLEQLLGHGVEKLIRLGSRSKSVALDKFNLFHVSQAMDATKAEGQEKWRCIQELNSSQDDIAKALEHFADLGGVASMKRYLETRQPRHYHELFVRAEDEGGFQTVRRKENNPLKSWLERAPRQLVSDRPIAQLLNAELNKMSGQERRILFNHWVRQIVQVNSPRLLSAVEYSNDARDSLKKCYEEVNLRCLRQAHVVGVTTTGLARNIDLLRRVGSKVLVCEEAGEVLEAHLLTALLPTVEHAVLIGDHEQLRPQINNYGLRHDNPKGEQYSLDVSLFERLIQPLSGDVKLPHSTLEVQRRMHPSIAELVRSTLYPNLQDHASVHDYPEVEGMRDRLFWLDHDHDEDTSAIGSAHSLSKSNEWEVEMTAALVSHLIRQGVYQSEDIAVLTPYLGQLHKLKKRLSSSFEIVVGERDQEDMEKQGIVVGDPEGPKEATSIVHQTTLLKALRIATVDNFQGEEAKVIVISLVRCNEQKRCGFLKTSNRINVLLSRARHGMYIIGNADTARPVAMWDQVISILERKGRIGKALKLCCPRHPKTPIAAYGPDDFTIHSPEGGCNQKCNDRLKCGHECVNRCHAVQLHNAVRCLARCPRIKAGCLHECEKVCGDPCDLKCRVNVGDIQLPCGHVNKNTECHFAQAPNTVECQALVDRLMPDCEHKVEVPCHLTPYFEQLPCRAKCAAPLPCGHPCEKRCGGCNKSDDNGHITSTSHGQCASRCGRNYNNCSHACSKPCHEDEACALCQSQCEVRCSHSRCSKKCFEPCAPCLEDCGWSCPHRGTCDLPCGVPCDRLPCSRRCTLILSCGHQCPSICAEVCPDVKYCQICADTDVKEKVVDFIMMSTYGELDLDKSPCIVPSCGHICTMESLDGHMDMAKFYNISESDDSLEKIVGLASRSAPFSAGDLKNCPECRGPLRDINRYGRIVRRAWIDEATKKFIVAANNLFVPLAARLDNAEVQLLEDDDDSASNSDSSTLGSAMQKMSLDSIELKGTPDVQMKVLDKKFRKKDRYKELFHLRRNIKRFLFMVDENEQPITRIHHLVQDAQRHRGANADTNYDAPDMVQMRHIMLASALLLRCEFIILSDVISRNKRAEIKLDLSQNRLLCEQLIETSHARQLPAQELEGHLFWCRFAALERNHHALDVTKTKPPNQTTNTTPLITDWMKEALDVHLPAAQKIFTSHPSLSRTVTSPTDLSRLEKALRTAAANLTFYSPLSLDERQDVYTAMAREFRGTGHWYSCVNGHPFTIGECGMPMERARCPFCDAAIGGVSHQLEGGVRRAEEWDRYRGQQ